jgi:hypothetical protein
VATDTNTIYFTAGLDHEKHGLFGSLTSPSRRVPAAGSREEPELRVTMVYTDPLGTTTALKALVNDLDLIVIAPDGKRYFGNHGLLEGNVSHEGGQQDRINNVENVFLDKPMPGVWRVLVAAHRIACNQQSATAARGQNFALVVSGVEREPVPPFTP